MHTIYRIPGMGLDKRVFSRLQFPDHYQVVDLEWQYHSGITSLGEYALILLKKINTEKPFSLVGLSMGGMVVMELLKQVKPEHAVLISSAKTREELPLRARIAGKTGMHHIIPAGLMKYTALKMLEYLVHLPGQQQSTLETMLKDSDARFFKWSLHAILTWDNLEVPHDIVHIHGTKDRTIPFKNIKEPVRVIEGGTHFMAGDRAGEINMILREVFK